MNRFWIAYVIFLMLQATPSIRGWAASADDSAPSIERMTEFFQAELFLDECFKHFEQVSLTRMKEAGAATHRITETKAFAARIYRKKNLYDVFKLAFQKSTTPDQLKSINAWMLSPLGLRLRKAYKSVAVGGLNARQSYLEKDAPKILKNNRKNAIATFVAANLRGQTFASMMAGMEYAALRANEAYTPSEVKESSKALFRKAKDKSSGYFDQGAKVWKDFDTFLLKDFKNQEIDDLSKFYMSPVGQGLITAINKSIELTLEGAANTLFQQIEKKRAEVQAAK